MRERCLATELTRAVAGARCSPDGSQLGAAMSELLREAILGTAHGGAGAVRSVDGLVSKLEGLERERALLLRAAVEALQRRAARVLPQRQSQLPLAEPETLRASSLRLTAAVRALLEQDDELLTETLTRMARASVRLAPELLPLALDHTSPALRDLLRPVLGQRGAWLAQQRPEWAWALAAEQGGTCALPPGFEQRWAEGNAAERRQLFTQLRKLDPTRARELVADAWKHERAEQRAAFADAFAIGLSPDDQTFLSGLLADRSALVQRSAARLLWRLPSSEVAERMLARARAHLRFVPGRAPQEDAWQVSLPCEPLDESWLRDGITEKPPDSSPLGQRQWWLQQLVAAVPCATWLASSTADAQQLAPSAASAPQDAAPVSASLEASTATAVPEAPAATAVPGAAGAWVPLGAASASAPLGAADVSVPRATASASATLMATGAIRRMVIAAARHEFGGAVLDGLTRAALQYDERSWFAPLWDAWASTPLVGAIAPDPRVLLSRKLSAQDVAARASRFVSEDKLRVLLPHLPRPWPEALALNVLAAISDLRLSFREIIPVAALAIPVALLPDALPLPESTQVEYPLRAFVRALADFQDVAALRRSIAAETIGDD